MLEGAGGEPFTTLVDALLRAHGAVRGLVDADIDTTIPDGGRHIDQASYCGDSTGWLSTAPTAWQYKSTDYKNIQKSKTLDGPRPVPGCCPVAAPDRVLVGHLSNRRADRTGSRPELFAHAWGGIGRRAFATGGFSAHTWKAPVG